MRENFRHLLAFIPVFASCGSLASAQLVITPTFDSSITSLSDAAAIESSIDADIATFETTITTVNPDHVTIDFENVNSGLGFSHTAQADIDYSTYLSGLQANPNQSATQMAALATMPAANVGIQNDAQVLLTASDLAAIGQSALAASLVSGNGGFNSTISLNFSQLNDSRPDANPSLYDLQSVAYHEIDEVLGIGGNATTLYQAGATPPSSLPTDVGPLDFFRYSAPGTRSFTYDPTQKAYFSIDGGKTNLVFFNQQNGANGADFGDWGNPQGTAQGNTPPQVQDAFGTPGGEVNLGTNELTGLQVIGYNLVVVPEPSTWAMLLVSVGLLAYLRMRRMAHA